MGNRIPKSFPFASSIPEMFLRVVTEHTNYLFTVIDDHEAGFNARDLIGRQAVSGFQGAVLVFRTPLSPDIFFAAAGWSSPFCKTKS